LTSSFRCTELEDILSKS